MTCWSTFEPLEMLCTKIADALAPRARDLKVEDLSLVSNVCLQEVKFILNPVLLLSFSWEPGQTWTG